MTDSINTSQNNKIPGRAGDRAPRSEVPRTSSPTSDVTEPVPAVPVAPPGLESVTGEPGYARQSDSGQSDSGQSSSGQGTSDQAKGAAHDVAGDAKDAGRAVKDTAAQEAAGVKDDAVREAKHLGDEAGTMLESQASEQLDRAAGIVRTFSDDVARIARGEKPEPGVAKDLVDQLNSRAEATATWLEDHDPKQVLQEVQSFARRRPVAFLAIAAGVGFAAGRLTRGVQQNHADDVGAVAPRHSAGHADSGTDPAGPGTTRAGSSSAAAAPVSGNQSAGAPAYETGPASPTPGYTGGTDPYAGGAGR